MSKYFRRCFSRRPELHSIGQRGVPMTNTNSDLGSIVWVVEDNQEYRNTIVSTIEADASIACGANFASAEDLLAALNTEVAPDTILLDIGLPEMNGVDCVKRIRLVAPGCSVIMLTIHEDNDTIFRALCAGASGYLSKTSSSEEIVAAIKTVRSGGAAMNPMIARRVLNLFSQFTAPAWDYGLSEREQETLNLLVDGKSKNEIAEALHLSPHTIDSHVRNIYTKLEVHSRSDAVVKALRERLV